MTMKQYEIQIQFENRAHMSFNIASEDILKVIEGFAHKQVAIGHSQGKTFLINMNQVTSILAKELQIGPGQGFNEGVEHAAS